jgi:hypothetical protein
MAEVEAGSPAAVLAKHFIRFEGVDLLRLRLCVFREGSLEFVVHTDETSIC